MFSAIRAFILMLPEIAALLKSVLEAANNLIALKKENELRMKLQGALDRVTETKDTSELENAFK